MKTSAADARKIGRLLKRTDFLRVQGSGVKWVTPTLILQMAPMRDMVPMPDRSLTPAEATGGGISCRFGLTATKKIFPNATDRNRVRRRLRALMIDLLTEKGISGVDFVVLPRVPALKSSAEALEKDLSWALRRIFDAKPTEKPKLGGKNGKRDGKNGKKVAVKDKNGGANDQN